MPRPSLLEQYPERIGQVAQLVADWNDPLTAAVSVGIPERSHFRYLEKGREDDEAEEDTPYSRYWQAIARARAEAEVSMIEVLRTHEDENGRLDPARVNAIRFLLETTRRERYGRTIEVRQKVDEVFRAELDWLCARLSPGSRREVLQALAERASGEEAG